MVVPVQFQSRAQLRGSELEAAEGNLEARAGSGVASMMASGTNHGMTVADALRFAAAKAPGAQAVVDDERAFSYAQLNADANRLANALLQRGVRHGDRVLCCMRNRYELVVAFFALQKIGAIYVPLNFRLSSAELAYCIQLTDPRAAIVEPGSLDLLQLLGMQSSTELIVVQDRQDGAPSPSRLVRFEDLIGSGSSGEPPVRVAAADTSLIFFTSGTTGRPKGVPRTHGNEIAATMYNLVAFPWRLDERLLGVMPLYHTMGVRLLLSSVLLLGANVVMRSWDANVAIRIIGAQNVSSVFLVPTMYHDLLRASEFSPARLGSLRSLGTAGMVIREDVLQEVREKLGELPFVNVYGSSEIYCFSFCDYLDTKPSAVGRGAPHQLLRIAPVSDSVSGTNDMESEKGIGDLGEIVALATAPDAFNGYWKNQVATERAIRGDWYYTGDLGYRDEDGDVYVVGRVDDMIVTGGENVHPLEVESVLMTCPGVGDCAVVGLSDRRWGHVVGAFIVRNDPSLTEEAVDEYCRRSARLASFKRPRQVHFVDEIPKSPIGKVLRRVLQEEHPSEEE